MMNNQISIIINKQFVLVFIGLFFVALTNAQQPCQAYFSQDMLQQFDEFIEYYYHRGGKSEQNTRTLKHIPMIIHLVGNDDGTKRVEILKALRLTCALNEMSEQANLYFFLDDIQFHDNTNWNTNTSGVRTFMPMNTKVGNTINVYFLGNTSASDICGVYYGSAVGGGNPGNTDIIVMSSGCANVSTFSHEIGHFLSLPHTFSGWEERGGIGNIGAAPAWAEKVNGLNCTTAGDKLCDTAPDYLYGRWDRGSSCDASGTIDFVIDDNNVEVELMDPDSISFTVNGRNIMSYASNSCRDSFTVDQIAAMHYHLENIRSEYVLNGASVDMIEEDVNLIYPKSTDETPFDEVSFEWEGMPNATHYLVQVNYAASFSSSVAIDEKIVTNNSATFFNLPVDRTLYWRVIPYNNSYTCHSGTSTSFKTGLFTANLEDVGIENIKAFRISPNPFALARSLSAYILSLEETSAEIFVHTINGQFMDHQAIQLSLGQNFVAIPNDNWIYGVYLVTLKTPNGKATRKLVHF